jgi:dienelactone hydrolase
MHLTLPSGTAATRVRPDGARHGLVIATDIFGLRPLFDDMAERLAAAYSVTVCVPEPFPGLGLGPDIEARQEAMAAKDDADTLRDLVEAADATGAEHVGLIGFCMGGMYCHKAAPTGRFERIVSFYGMIRLPERWRSPGQGEPLDLLARGGAERVLALVGERDPYTPKDDIDALEAAGVSVVRYPDAEHGFVHDPSRASYRADDAADAWERCGQWLGA